MPSKTVGNLGNQSFTFAAAAMPTCHVGFGAGFVDKYHTGRIYIGLISLPELTFTRDERSLQLAGRVQFFEADSIGLKKL
mgnify:CR=1 FL=1